MVKLNAKNSKTAHLNALMYPLILAAHYDRKNRQIVIKLSNGATFSFPTHYCQILHQANEEDIADIEILAGDVYWPKLDEALSA